MGACRVKAAVRRASGAASYRLQLQKVIEKEREARRLREEEQQQERLAEEERKRAAILAQEKHKMEAQGDELCEEVSQSINGKELDMAREQLELAAECYKQAGRTDKDSVIKELERQIQKAEDRELSRQEGEVEMERAEKLLANGDKEGAKMAVLSAKTHFERALATDMLDQVDKIMLRLQQEDDKETYLADAQAAEAEAAAAVKKNDFKAASAALTRARVAYKRAGGAATSSLDKLETEVAQQQKAQEAEESKKKKEEEELKKMSEQEQSAAEEQAKAMEREARQIEKEALERAQAQQQKQLEVMDSQMAVAVGGYGHERPTSLGGGADLREQVCVYCTYSILHDILYM